MRLSKTCLLLVVGGLVTGCRGCGEKGPETILGLVDRNTAGVIHVPDIDRLRLGADGFVLRATRKAGPKLVLTLRRKLEEQIGFDPLATTDWSKIGLDAAAGAVLFGEGDSERGLLALGISDRDRFDRALRHLIERLDGANQHRVSDHHGRGIHTVGRTFGSELVPVMHWSHFGSYVLVTGDQGLETLRAALSRLGTQKPGVPLSLAADPSYAELRSKVPAGQIHVLARGQASQFIGATGIAIGGDSVASLRLSPKGISGDLFMPFPGQGLAEVFAGAPTLDLASRVANDAVVVAMTRSLNAESLAALHQVGAVGQALDSSRKRLQGNTGIDPEKEAIPNFSGPMTLSIHLHDLENLPARFRSRSLAAVLNTVHFAMTAELKDRSAMLAILRRSQAALTARGTTIRATTRKIGSQEAVLFEPDRPEPRFGWGVIGDTYVYTAGDGRLELTLGAVAANQSTLPQELAAGVGGEMAKRPDTSVVILRSGAVADAVARAKLGGVLAGVVGSLLELLRTLGDVSLAVNAEEAGMRVELRENLQ